VRPLLIDTNAYTGFLRGDAELVDVFASAERLLLNCIVLGELLAGFALGTREGKNRSELARLLASPRVAVVPVTADTADSYAVVYAGLRRKGQPIPTNDMWIAASALEHGAAVLTRDAHFRSVEGLRVGCRISDFLP
jgi:predicted nucleic acid-binding protein